MKKTSSLFFAGAAALLLTGCNQIPGLRQTSETTTTGTADEMSTAWEAALKSGQGVVCTFTDQTSGEVSTAKIKGSKSHITMTTAASAVPSTEMINDSVYMYSWEPAKKTGFKMKLPTAEEIQKMSDQNQQPPELDEVPDVSTPEKIQELEDTGAKVDCAPSNVAESEFTVPTDVTFQDYSEMMNKALESAQQGMTEEQKKQLQDAMQQYQQ